MAKITALNNGVKIDPQAFMLEAANKIENGHEIDQAIVVYIYKGNTVPGVFHTGVSRAQMALAALHLQHGALYEK